jgi:tetratricopeptide (TPR) repeat protein
MTDRPTLEADLIRHQKSGDFAAQAETLMALAEIAYEEQECNIAQGLYGQAWAAYQKAGNKQGEADATKRIAQTLSKIFWSDDDFFPNFELSDIEIMYDGALALYKEIDNKYGQADIHMLRGNDVENTDEARQDAVKEAIECYKDLGDSKKQADALMLYVGIDYLPNDEYAFLVGQALFLYQKINDIQGEANAYHRLGLHASWEKRYEDAQILFEMALTRFSLVNDEEGLAWIYMRLLSVVEATQDYPTYLQKAQTVIQQLKRLTLSVKDNQWGRLWNAIRLQALKNSDFHTARLMFQYDISLYVNLNDIYGVCLMYWNWGDTEYYRADRREMGIALCQRAVTLMQHYHHYNLEDFQQQIDQMRLALVSSQNPPNNP